MESLGKGDVASPRRRHLPTILYSTVVKRTVKGKKSAEELLETYMGREDPLPVNALKMNFPRETYLEPLDPWLVEPSKTEVPDAPARDLLPGLQNLANASTRHLLPGSQNLANIDIDDNDDALMALLEDRASGEMKAKQERDADATREISAPIKENADAKDKTDMLAGHHRGQKEPLPKQLSGAKTNRERVEETRASVRALAALKTSHP